MRRLLCGRRELMSRSVGLGDRALGVDSLLKANRVVVGPRHGLGYLTRGVGARRLQFKILIERN